MYTHTHTHTIAIQMSENVGRTQKHTNAQVYTQPHIDEGKHALSIGFTLTLQSGLKA